MASFEDLPQDVLWLIFQNVIKIAIKPVYPNVCWFEEPHPILNPLSNNPYFMDDYLKETVKLSLINKNCFRLVKKKCVRKNKNEWMFIRGALTNKYLKKK